VKEATRPGQEEVKSRLLGRRVQEGERIVHVEPDDMGYDACGQLFVASRSTPVRVVLCAVPGRVSASSWTGGQFIRGESGKSSLAKHTQAES
jgi:hypothetical protein